MVRKLRIVLFGPLPSLGNVGGPENITYNLAKWLSKFGHDVFVFKGFFGSGMSKGNISTHDLIHPSTIKKSDIIHIVSTLKSGGFIGAYFAKSLNKPLISHFHQLPDWHFKGFKSIKYAFLNTVEGAIMQNIFKMSDKVISVSSYSRKVLLNAYGVDSIVIPPGVDEIFLGLKNTYNLQYFFKKYRLKKDGGRILFVGNLIPRKGVEYLLHAFKIVKDNVKEASLVIVGDGVDKHRLMSLTYSLNLRDVYFLDRIPKNDLIYAYLSSDIFVLPSLEEGLGIVLLEAMACGLPVVASKTSGVLDVIIDQKNGILVPPKNAEALANAIIKVLKDEKLRNSIATFAREYVKTNFDWRNIAKKIENLYYSSIMRHFRLK